MTLRWLHRLDLRPIWIHILNVYMRSFLSEDSFFKLLSVTTPPRWVDERVKGGRPVLLLQELSVN
jgi:hypothetical protein